MSTVTTNVAKVKQAARRTEQQYRSKAPRLAVAIGQDMRDNIRKNIAPPLFPGYAISGALARKTISSPAQRVQNGWKVVVQVLQTGRQKKYARIHEVGGVIKPRRAQYLRFFIPGVGWRRAKSVRIRGKSYFERGVTKTRQTWTRTRISAFLNRE